MNRQQVIIVKMEKLAKNLTNAENLNEYTKLQKELLELSERFLEAGKKIREHDNYI